jgi:hypothetical protein
MRRETLWAISVLTWTAGCSVDDIGNASRDAPAGIEASDAGSWGPEVSILVLPEAGTTDGGLCPALA